MKVQMILKFIPKHVLAFPKCNDFILPQLFWNKKVELTLFQIM